ETHRAVFVKVAIFDRERRLLDAPRNVLCVEPFAARLFRRQRLVQHDSVAIDDRRGGRFRRPDRRQRTEPQPRDERNRSDDDRCDCAREAPFHGLTSTTSLAVRPNTSGLYISSALIGAAVNVPAVVARTRYEYSCGPSDKRVAKRFTRSS